MSNCTNGVCVDGECECNPGYSGADCETFSCVNECSGHGNCDISLGRCRCHPWYTGEDCSTALCPANCSGHGICSNGLCVCDNRHAGYDCSIPKCPYDCSGRGICLSDSTCSCQTGYYGTGCEIMGNCPMANCSGHGTCEDSTCICDAGWAGSGCEEALMVSRPHHLSSPFDRSSPCCIVASDGLPTSCAQPPCSVWTLIFNSCCRWRKRRAWAIAIPTALA